MTTLYGLLNTGRQAMSVQKLAIAVTGNNIANAATPGYSRQALRTSPDIVVRAAGYGNIGNGVRVDTISRSFDQFTYQRILREETRSGYYGLQQSELHTVSAAYNESSTGGLADDLNRFFSSFNAISANPEGTSERNVALAEGESLVNRFHSLARTLNQSRVSLDNKIEDSVSLINDKAARVAKLNAQIATAEGAGDTAGSLRDERELLLREIAAEADVTVRETDNGTVTVLLAGRVIVEDDVHRELVTTEDPDNDSMVRISVLSDSTLHDITDQLSGGQLAGALSLRDTTIPGYQDELDNLAFTLVNEFNTQHQAGFGLDGLDGRDFFEPLGGVAGAALNIAISSDVEGDPDAIAASSTATGIPGDNINAVALFQLSQKEVIGAQTFVENFIAQAGQVGTDTQTVDGEVAFQQQLMGELDALQDSISGVSVDQEATDLLKFQGAYTAAARFIGVVKEVMDTLMQM